MSAPFTQSQPCRLRIITADERLSAAANKTTLAVVGESGTGKTTLARATHRSRTPAAHLRVLDADDYGPQWLADVAEELGTPGGTLLLPHVDRLPEEGLQALAGLLEPHRASTSPERPWVVATVSRPSGAGDSELSALLACFARTVVVPPLRHHVEDVAELVPHLLTRLTRGSGLSCSPQAMRVLVHGSWPGNVEQVLQVLHKVVSKRRSGVVEVGDQIGRAHV